MKHAVFPFAAIIGQEPLKTALILNAVNPRIGGVLIRGEKGTAKSTAVRALAHLLPGMPMVTLPLNATEDRVAGGIDFSLATRTGAKALQKGLLAQAHNGFLYVDEVNLLDDHIVDIILDAAASGVNRIEREGISFRHEAQFILVGTMNPEEGELRPQLLDRFGLCVEVSSIRDIEKRVLLMQKKEAYDADPDGFSHQNQADAQILSDRIIRARKMLEQVEFSDDLRAFIADLCSGSYVAGHRADLVIEQAAKALAAFHGSPRAGMEEVKQVAGFALIHRKRDPLPPPAQDDGKAAARFRRPRRQLAGGGNRGIPLGQRVPPAQIGIDPIHGQVQVDGLFDAPHTLRHLPFLSAIGWPNLSFRPQ